MDFIKLNWWRLFTRAFASALFFEIIFGITYWADSRSGNSVGTALELLLIYPACLGLFFSCIAFYLAMLRFYAARKLYKDDSETSLRLIFDNDNYNIVPENKGLIVPASEYLAGAISSYPVIVLYSQDRSSKYKPRIHIGAFIIDKERETMVAKSFDVSVSFKGKLKHSLQDEVNSFIGSLKQSNIAPNPNPDYSNRNKYFTPEKKVDG